MAPAARGLPALQGAATPRRSTTTTTSRTAFYEMVLGPSMTYTCAVFPTGTPPSRRRRRQVRPGLPQARPPARACGCSTSAAAGAAWSGTPRALRRRGRRGHAVRASRPPGRRRRSSASGLDDVAEVRFGDYRDVARHRLRRGQLDRPHRAHRGPQLPVVLRVPAGQAASRAAGCSTTASPGPTTPSRDTGAFIDRYVFPDGELTGSGRIITEIQDVGLEVRHEENLREHYALTLKGWCENLEAQLGRVRRARSARAPPRCGASTWPAPGCPSSATRSSCTRCSAVKPDRRRQRALPAAPDLARLTSAGRLLRAAGAPCRFPR